MIFVFLDSKEEQTMARFAQHLEHDSDGRVIMYHGTTTLNAQEILRSGFKQSVDGLLGRGVYLSPDIEKAEKYPFGYKRYQKCIIKVAVDLGKVKRITYIGGLQKTWQYNGYDTAWVPANCGLVPSGLEEDCIFDPDRISIISVHANTMVEEDEETEQEYHC